MSAERTMNILLIGGTGAIGKFITAAVLDAKADFGRVALFTSASTLESKSELLKLWKAQGLEVIVGDITKDEDIVNAYQGFDTVVSAVGRNVIASQTNLIRLAEASDTIMRFFPSEYGTDIEYFPHSAKEKPHQQKLKVRAFLKNNTKRLRYTYVVTGPYPEMYMGNTKAAPDAGTFDIVNKKAILLGDGNGKVSFTTMPDTGKLVVAALRHPEASKNRPLKVNSFTTTPNEILAEYEKQTGSKWSVTYQPLDALKKTEEQAWSENRPTATVYTLRRIWTEGGTLYDVCDNEKIGSPEMSNLQEVVSLLVEQQTT